MRVAQISKKFLWTRGFKNGVSIKIEKRDLFDRVFQKIFLKHKVTKWPRMVQNSALAGAQYLRRLSADERQLGAGELALEEPVTQIDR